MKEEGFNKTLDKGIALFEGEVERRLGSARDSRAVSGDSPEISPAESRDTRSVVCRISSDHGESNAVTFSTVDRRSMTPAERDIVLDCVLFPGQQEPLRTLRNLRDARSRPPAL